jgi:hypothetical protein
MNEEIQQPVISVVVAAAKDPLSYPLKQWALVLGLALFGGIASWWAKVRKGTVAFHNLQALIGELTISAFAGVMVFLICEYMNLAPTLTAAIVGMAGHMGNRAISFVERRLSTRITNVLVPNDSDHTPLGKD